ncbi:trypsin-like peptidase domain-containing protein [Actinoplanes sp. NPDC051470]|uniref:trypsin-like peptidase domain-containing protein n=1 Tax=Actinoplanes sp. NPDC051470 TaxID=3157224 RepID=UPI00343B6A45
MSTALDALARRSLVQIRLDREHYRGVGFVIAPGLVVTNAHVAEEGIQVWYGGEPHECTVRRYPAERANGSEWPWPDLAELAVPTLEADPVLLGPPFTGAGDIEGLGEVRVPTFDLAYVATGPERLEPITKRLVVSITGDGLIGLGGGTLDLGMSGSPVIDMRSGRVRGVVKSAAWAQAQVQYGAKVPTGGWMIPLTGSHTPASWFESNAAANPPGNRWRLVAADAERVQQELFRRTEPPAEITPANLLDPDTGVTPFEPMAELDELLDWCRTEGRTVVRLVSATSGTGKNRVAHELCDRLRGEGWAAGILRPSFRDAGWLRTLAQALERELQVCVVVDDAEHRGPDVAAILREVSDALDAAPAGLRLTARVVLLSRNDPDRFEEEFLSIDIDDDEFARWIRSVQKSPILLPQMLPDAPAVLSRAWRAFASRLGVATEAEPLWPRDISARTTLDLYAIAVDEVLSALPGYEQDHRGSMDPLETIRRHQLRYWSRRLRDADYQLRAPPPKPVTRPKAGSGPVHISLITAEAWLLVPTLVASTDEAPFRQVMTRAALALGAPGLDEIDTLLKLYPVAADRRPAALTPDRLAEIVFRHVCRDLDEFTLCALLAAVLVGEGADVHLGLRLICRSRADPDTAGDAAHDRIDAALTTLLAEYPRELLPALTRVCGEVPHMAPLVKLLTVAAEESELDVLPLVEEHLPDDGRGLSPLAVVVLRRLADATAGNDDHSLFRRVSWWRRLSLHQYHLDRDEALNTNQDAINECRVLQARGERHAATFARLHGDRALFLLRQVQAQRARQEGNGPIGDALINGEIAVRAYEKLGRENETALADVLHNQDILYSVRKRSRQALQYGRRALRLYGENGPRRSRAAAHSQVAEDLDGLGRVDEALVDSNQSVAILTDLFREAPSAYATDLVRALGQRAYIQLHKGTGDRREGKPGATALLVDARKDLVRADQILRRWSPVHEPGLEIFLRRVGVVLEKHLDRMR